MVWWVFAARYTRRRPTSGDLVSALDYSEWPSIYYERTDTG